MSSTEKILVVVDPARDQHPTVERAISLAHGRREDTKVELIFLLAANPESFDQNNGGDHVTRDGLWVTRLLQEMANTEVEHQIMVSWTTNWAQSILDVARQHDVSLSLIPDYGSQRDHIWTDERWKLLRQSEQPVIIVTTTKRAERGRLLATIKDQDSDYSERNAHVLAVAHRIASNFGMELHVANAYTDSMDFPDRARIAQRAQVENEHVHIQVGDPEDVICELAQTLNVDVVLIANQRRQGLQGRLRGNTVEKIVGRLDRDVLMI
ncbi:universal stress protein [Pseudomaricurvus alkylphenolicus]|uniref:universal stress protein n=1 Tax=Pseudomaricurvus alkylphenolicus TaxID=1306991 RepID=UPI0014243450|nr:universal stress protein [Pseudomaricurvus alkylphenolicus]NIB38721.1 universal stress protein [Pseudomaricurvus alkylphenolicus]